MTSMESGVAEFKRLFDLLESNQATVVNEIKNLIQENFNTIKENWLVGGLYDYYIQTHSTRCMEILISIAKEPHDRFLIEKIIDGLRSVQHRKQSLIFLGHLVRKQPSWLYKIANMGLIKEVIKILKNETDMVILLTGLLCITTTLPIIPTYLTQFINEIFDVFGRLAVWGHSTQGIAEDHILHLQVGLYSLFHRLYAMFPCNFLSYLRHNFSATDKKIVFLHAIKPMLETVKMHPLLVTATKEGELSPNRWKNKEYHDVIAECSLLSLDVLESGLPEEINSIHLRPRASTTTIDFTTTSIPTQNEPFVNISIVPPSQLSSLIQNAVKSDFVDLAMVANIVDESTPQTPLTAGGTQPTLTVPTNTPLINKGTSPPEAAMEATPENTPLATPVKDREKVHFRLPPHGSPAVAHLAFGGKPPSLTTRVSQTPPVTPSNSTPSSPAPHTGESSHSAGVSLYRRDSIFDPLRRDSIVHRLHKVQVEQQNSQGKEEIKRPSPITMGDAVVTLEPIPGSLPESDPLTPMLGSTGDLSGELEDTEEHICSTTCPIGGVAIPDTRSMMAFAKRVSRLRYNSHCGDQSLAGVSPGTSHSDSSGHFPAQKLKRSTSCPDIFKKPITEEFSDSDETDGASNSSQKETQPQVPLVEDHAQPYEQFFEGILPQFLQYPGENHSQIQSPHHLLDLCISKAAELHGRTKEDDIQVLKIQVELLHSQLLFERHRRESHALRNRSLAKKCRSMQHKDEMNTALKSQLHGFDKEVAMLKKEIVIQRGVGLAKEKDNLLIISDLENKVENYRREITSLQEAGTQLETKFAKVNFEYQALLKESDFHRADIFQLENENKHCLKYVDTNAELRTAYETAQKEILLLGELCRRQKEIMSTFQPQRHILREMEDLRNCCEHEINELRNTLETRASQTEAALGFVKNLEEQLVKKDCVIAEQQKIIKQVRDEWEEKLKSLHGKYEEVSGMNSKLEMDIMNLNHQLALKSYSKGVVRRISPSNGQSSHNSNASDVDSAASAGGMQLSPERSMFIFGSPQFDPPPIEMSDLQRVIDKSEPDARE